MKKSSKWHNKAQRNQSVQALKAFRSLLQNALAQSRLLLDTILSNIVIPVTSALSDMYAIIITFDSDGIPSRALFAGYI